MYKHYTLILIAFLIAPTLVLAENAADPQKMYLDFNKKYDTLISGSPTKTDFIKNYSKLETKLNQLFEDYISKRERLLQPQAVQMSIDLEMLEPLKMLAESKISPESCEEAYHNNDLNSMADIATAKKIATLMDKLCK